MTPDLQKKLEEMEAKIDAIHTIQKKIHRNSLWMLIITIAVIVLPAIGLLFAIPTFMETYSTISSF